MKHYKLINGNVFVGIATQLDFRRYQKKHNLVLACDEATGEYIQCGDKLYHASWMVPLVTDDVPFEIADVIQISEMDYDILNEAIESGKDIEVDNSQDLPVEDSPIVEPEKEVTIEFVRESKIAEMSAVCNNTITNGFDMVLDDNSSHHFSLSVQDQLNLVSLSAMIAAGKTEIPYHADDELCRMFSVNEINAIVEMATNFKTYHITYFNSLKAYINSMNEIEEIANVTYGIDIPEEYQSDILKGINDEQHKG